MRQAIPVSQEQGPPAPDEAAEALQRKAQQRRLRALKASAASPHSGRPPLPLAQIECVCLPEIPPTALTGHLSFCPRGRAIRRRRGQKENP